MLFFNRRAKQEARKGLEGPGDVPIIVSDVLNNSMRATNCVYANHPG